ncbi:hypothetical protein J4429_04670 [Candidatus Pacearchaeota archaeon]|nr:hypothetical protein [Candidatus Pacearchaeota archaeon]
MFIVLKKQRLKEIIYLAIKKAGSIRKLKSEVNIPRSTIFGYYQEKNIINEKNLQKILDYLKIKLNEEDILKKLPDNWKQIKGGKKCVEIKKLNGTYEEQLRKCREKIKKGGSENLKLWHANMKKKNPEEYYILQYERFKKVGNYKFQTKNGEKVRNKLEKEIANLLKELKIEYKYEALVKISNHYFFPDFLIDDKIIIECTEWRGFDKAIKLKNKIQFLEKKYKVYVVIPKALNRYYEILNNCLVLGTENLIPKLMFP